MSSGDKTGIAIFASGTGSNALKIIEYFSDHPQIAVRAVICNNPSAGVLQHAYGHHIPALVITRRLLNDQDWMLRQLTAFGADYLVLAGFLLLIPSYLVDTYPDKIVNIHPALLPKYGGKGMYGMHVHEAVLAAGETESGITIHKVNTQYDDGEILLQKTVAVSPEDTPETLASKVHQLEHAWFAPAIEQWITRS